MYHIVTCNDATFTIVDWSPRARFTNKCVHVDVATTAMAHLGIEIDDEWDLDGRAVGFSPAG